jgi:hypothetical protein
MPDVVLSNDDLTVLSGPETIELLVDIGPTGTRGSKVFVGVGNPNSVAISTKILNDLYINSAPGSDYGYLYQYVSEPGGDTWVEVLKISPSIYSKNHTVTFASGTSADSGSGTIVVPITDITAVTGLDADNFSVQYSIVNSNPLASSLASVTISSTNLVINLQASEYDGTWGAFDAEVLVHLFISVVI